MIGYTTIGTNDMKRAVSFFDNLLSLLDARKTLWHEGMIVWSSKQGAMLAVCKPYDGEQAKVGNGVMIALNADNKEKVNELYKKAIELGGTDEGEPGLRGEAGIFYGGYFRDLDGNKFCAFCIQRG